MTADALRRAIAEALGVHFRFDDEGNRQLWGPNGRLLDYQVAPSFVRSDDEAWQHVLERGSFSVIPDWPNDAGETLDLCLELAHRLHADTRLCITPGPAASHVATEYTVQLLYLDIYTRQYVEEPAHREVDDSLALALSRLALTLLRGPEHDA